MARGAQDYQLLEMHMDVTAKLLDVQQAVERALAESREFAGRLEAAAMEKRREQRAETQNPR